MGRKKIQKKKKGNAAGRHTASEACRGAEKTIIILELEATEGKKKTSKATDLWQQGRSFNLSILKKEIDRWNSRPKMGWEGGKSGLRGGLLKEFLGGETATAMGEGGLFQKRTRQGNPGGGGVVKKESAKEFLLGGADSKNLNP